MGKTFVGYIRVSTGEQAESGAGLEAQERAIRAEAARRGWTLANVYKEAGASAKSLSGRPQLQAALKAVDSGAAEGLVVAKLDRLSRSLVDFAGLMARSRKRGWALIALDLGVDTTTASGELMAHILATFAQFERRLISDRTRVALAVRKSQGVKLGHPNFKATPAAVAHRIASMRTAGESFAAIAALLNAEGIATAQGGSTWHPSSVRAVLIRRPGVRPLKWSPRSPRAARARGLSEGGSS